MSTTAAPENRPRPTRLNPEQVKQPLWHRMLPTLFFLLIGLLLVALMTLIFGQVSGEEFSPDTFGRRSFRYHQIPLIRRQVTPVTRRDTETGIALTVGGHAPNLGAIGTEKEWDLVNAQRPGGGAWQGDAQILCDYLDIRNEGHSYAWDDWTDDHPLLADAFWPFVVDVAKARAYVLVPELFEIAEAAGFSYEQDDDKNKERQQAAADQLKIDLTSFLQSQASQVGQQLIVAGETELAFRAFKLAVDYGAEGETTQNYERLLPEFEALIIEPVEEDKDANSRDDVSKADDGKAATKDTEDADDSSDEQSEDEAVDGEVEVEPSSTFNSRSGQSIETMLV